MKGDSSICTNKWADFRQPNM